MQLLVIRHAIAGDKEEFARTGRDDALRPLTEGGREKMTRVAGGLRTLVPELELLATSPLVRAKETAAIVAAAYDPAPPVDLVEALAPGSAYDALEHWLSHHRRHGTIGIVGHEPHLGGLVTWLLTGGAESHTPLKKGGAALLSFEGAPGRARATLAWLLTPGIARRL